MPGWSTNAARMCCISFTSRNFSKSWEINWGPLLLTSCSGKPNRLNISPSFSMVCSVAVDFIMANSDHLLTASTRNILFSNGPAKLLPCLLWPVPWMMWSQLSHIMAFLTWRDWLWCIFKLPIKFWPPEVASGGFFLADHSTMAWV